MANLQRSDSATEWLQELVTSFTGAAPAFVAATNPISSPAPTLWNQLATHAASGHSASSAPPNSALRAVTKKRPGPAVRSRGVRLSAEQAVVFRLCKAKLSGSILQHCCAVVDEIMSMGLTVFKFGITNDPHYRWSRPGCGYCHDTDRFTQMVCLAQMQTAEGTGMLEASLIYFYRTVPGCRNVALGGESIVGEGPIYIYIVFRTLPEPPGH